MPRTAKLQARLYQAIGVVRDEPDQPAIDLQGAAILALGGQVVGVDPQGVDEERIALEDPTQKLDLEVDLALLAQPPGRSLGRLGVPRTNRPDDPEVRPSQSAPSRPVVERPTSAGGTGREAVSGNKEDRPSREPRRAGPQYPGSDRFDKTPGVNCRRDHRIARTTQAGAATEIRR